MSWYDSLSGALERAVGVFDKLAEALSKSTLDKTEKERLLNQLENAKLNFVLESIKTRLAVPWMKWVALGSGVLLAIMTINNYVVMPYVAGVQAMEIPDLLLAVFAVSIGGDELVSMVNKKREGK